MQKRCSIILIAILFSSCSSIKLSEYRKFNKVDPSFFQSYYNDSLKLSIDFSWIQSYDTSFSRQNKRVIIPATGRRILKQFMYLKPELFYISNKNNPIGLFDYRYYSLIVPNQIDLQNIRVDTFISIRDKKMFISKDFVQTKEETSCFLIIPLEKHSLIFICSKKIDRSDLVNLSHLIANVENDFESILTDNDFVVFNEKKRAFLKQISDAFNDDEYIKPVTDLISLGSTDLMNYSIEHYYYQALLTRISFFDDLSEIKRINQEYRQKMSNLTVDDEPAPVPFPKNDAIKNILEQAQNNKVLFFNESHYDFRHRLLIQLLLPDLYQLGYRYLCLEDRNPDFKDDVPSKEAGFYIREPFMADLVREAAKNGFHLFGFDYVNDANQRLKYSSAIDRREYNMGYNLAKLYQSDSLHKWIVLTGYDHLNETGFSKGQKSATQYFTDFSGVNPFTINQTFYCDLFSNTKLNDSFPQGYYAIDSSAKIYQKMQADLYIINNVESNPFEKPFDAIKGRLKEKTIVIPEYNSPDQHLNLSIYVAEEYRELADAAVPVYIKKVAQPQYKLFLPDVDFICVLKTGEEKRSEKNLLIGNATVTF